MSEAITPVDGEDFCLLIDRCLGQIGTIVSILQQVKTSRKTSGSFLEGLEELFFVLETTATDLKERISTNHDLVTLVRANDPNGALPKTVHPRKIDELGLGPTVIRMRKENRTIKEIAATIGMSTDTVSDWLNAFAIQGPEQRAVTLENSTSVFNVKERLEEHQETIRRILSKLEAQVDGEIEGAGVPLVMAASEMTKVYKLSFELMSKVEEITQRENFKKAMVAALDRVSPGFRNLLYEEIHRLMNESRMLVI